MIGLYISLARQNLVDPFPAAVGHVSDHHKMGRD